MISFNLNCIMQLKQFYNIATKVSSRKKCYYYWWSTWLIKQPDLFAHPCINSNSDVTISVCLSSGIGEIHTSQRTLWNVITCPCVNLRSVILIKDIHGNSHAFVISDWIIAAKCALTHDVGLQSIYTVSQTICPGYCSYFFLSWLYNRFYWTTICHQITHILVC